jgi:hypothetical protein
MSGRPSLYRRSTEVGSCWFGLLFQSHAIVSRPPMTSALCPALYQSLGKCSEHVFSLLYDLLQNERWLLFRLRAVAGSSRQSFSHFRGSHFAVWLLLLGPAVNR